MSDNEKTNKIGKSNGCKSEAKKDNFDIRQQMFDFIYVIAMQDAVRQKAYKGERKWLWDLSDGKIKDTRVKLQSFINDIIKGKFNSRDKQEEYDSAFVGLAADICIDINKLADERVAKAGKKRDGNFTFGNAQKLINMVCKYFYVISYDNMDLRTCFICCHCPMDGILLERIWDHQNEWKDLKESLENTSKKIITEEYFKKSWGNEDFEKGENIFPFRYDCFQKAVRKLVEKSDDIQNSIEFDYKEW